MPGFRDLLASGRPVRGVMLAANSPAIVELLAYCGFDYVLIDLQHTPASWETAEHLIRAAGARGIAALIRVPTLAEHDMLKALDIGADGIVLPFVRTADEVRAAVRAIYYYPDGDRSICSQTRVAQYGRFSAGYAAHMKSLNERAMLIGVVEDMEGVGNLSDILSVPGLDAIAVGRGDLAASLGVAGKQDAPEITGAVDQALAAISAAPSVANGRCSLMVFTYTEKEIDRWLAYGTRIFCHMSEISLLAAGAATYLGAFDGKK
ncbi:MAG: hypothetical protein H6883_15540 [Rhodobiaceae bacterium]|nr:hypothetical protein [Rhodobiaceae bacterium]